jgi:hypothetical protein
MQNEQNTNAKSHNSEVEIHIDKQPKKSPTPTTGHALYVLGGIDATKYDLWLEIPGKGDDQIIANDSTPIDLKNGEHFYSAQKDLNPGVK